MGGNADAYMLHVSRKTLNRRGDGALYFSQKVLFRLKTPHILLGQQMNKTPTNKETELFLKMPVSFILVLCQYCHRSIHFYFGN